MLNRTLTKKEIKRILQKGFTGKNKLRDRMLFITMLSCGLRVSEAINLKVSDLCISDSATPTIRVQNLKKNRKDTRRKLEKVRLIPMNNKLQKLMANYLLTLPPAQNGNQYLFPSRGSKLSRQQAHNILKNAFKRAGVEDATTHTCRHTFASQIVLNGFDILTLKELLGHESISSTSRYLHANFEKMKKAVKSVRF